MIGTDSKGTIEQGNFLMHFICSCLVVHDHTGIDFGRRCVERGHIHLLSARQLWVQITHKKSRVV